MDLKRTRSRQRIGMVLLLISIGLCPGVRPIVHRHTEYGDGVDATTVLEWHLASFHRRSAGEPCEAPEGYHLHWLLVCQGALDPHCQLHAGVYGSVLESIADASNAFPRWCMLQESVGSFSLRSIDCLRNSGSDSRTAHHPLRLVRSAHALYGIARI